MPKEMPMTKMKLAAAGLFAVAMFAAPAMAQEATQEPGMMGFNYPNTAYLRGGYGHSSTPRPRDYYAGRAYREPGLPAVQYGYAMRPYGSYYGSDEGWY
jgi:hypothetical protein